MFIQTCTKHVCLCLTGQKLHIVFYTMGFFTEGENP